jgi:N6-adenosine-specific RNA methylase IME4
LTYPIHDVANIFPEMGAAEFDALCADIAANGLRESPWVYQGAVIDGRHRMRACAKLGVPCPVRVYSGDDPVGFVVSLNLHRRHLSPSQLAFVGLEIERVEASLAKSRRGGDRRSDEYQGDTNITLVDAGKARDKAAKAVGVGPSYISDAKRIEREAPELAQKIKAGETTITQAKREMKETAREARRDENRALIALVPAPAVITKSAKFATIVIDPPWDWGDEGDQDQLGRARPTYGTMSIEELLDLPVYEMADDDAHIYLWITNRSLPKGFKLLERWGFRYITALTWCKPSIGMGNYFRGSTEHVLFGVKGSQPLKRRDVGTWFQMPRGPQGHSSKPVDFYSLVESCSPGPYLEMFARSGRKDWTPWGAEADAA